ncbi:hypothetical protein T11_1049 [Trichinella zimbabwensis]|uniref:Uncharacterized protein n=2 Tax=Trichinella TaxID=6333 RepID=A0A0V1EP92_TRIPS|nr:hypothetical protein T4A_6774 [Trichinella pseudospiralis]KRZ12522.1 hypothetical protein T11_1049 [Trichinella zimbabwensis]
MQAKQPAVKLRAIRIGRLCFSSESDEATYDFIPLRHIVADRPRLIPFVPRPPCLISCLAMAKVLCSSTDACRSTWRRTFTASKGFTTIASVTPQSKPANE